MPKAAARVKTPPMCPQHPNEPQVMHPKGGFIGKCEICLALKPEALPKLPPSPEPGEIIQAEFEVVSDPEDLPLLPLETAPDIPMCKTHPDRPAVINRKGISMGKCRECIVANGKAGGKLTSSPVIYMLRAPRHQELLKFLQDSAEENERTLEQEVIYRLKMMM